MARMAQGGTLETAGVAAASAGLRECLQWFGAERQWINERHLELCRIPAPTFREQERAEWMATQFRELGWEARIDRVGNLLAEQGTSRSGGGIAVTAHLDTVLAPRAPEEITVLGDGRFRGPGVADNGAGLAALLALAAALKAAPPPFPLPFLPVANVGEEGEGKLSGMRYLCRHSSLASRIRGFVVLDGPSLDHITCQALACRRFEVSFSGPGGHSWSNSGAANAVHALSRAVALFVDGRAAAAPEGRASFNVGTIEGGTSVNSIPSSARAKVDLR